MAAAPRSAKAWRTFNERYAQAQTLNSRSVVLILSDGYDTGCCRNSWSPELARLKRKARRIVWLNPLLGWRDYAPVARAMAAALPLAGRLRPGNTAWRIWQALEPMLRRLK